MILSDDVNDGDSIDDGTACDGDSVEPTGGDEQCSEHGDCCTEVIDNFLHWNGKSKVR